MYLKGYSFALNFENLILAFSAKNNVESFFTWRALPKTLRRVVMLRYVSSNDMRNEITWKAWSESIAMLPPFGPIEGHQWFFQISSQWEPCGDTSNAATVDVRTPVVSLLMEQKGIFFLRLVAKLHLSRATVATFDVSPLGLDNIFKLAFF